MRKTLFTFLSLLFIFVTKAQSQSLKFSIDEDTVINISVDKSPEFPGGVKKFNQFLDENIQIPANSVGKNIHGKVAISMIVERNGSLSKLEVTNGLSDDLNKEALRVMGLSPKWHPGILNGRAVRTEWDVQIPFKTAKALIADTSIPKPVTVTIDSPIGGDPKDGIYTVVEHAPDFPGGLTAFYHFLSTNIRYPESARKRNQQGRVIVTMVLEKNGTLANIKIIRGVSDDIDAEAIRVMKLCPKWTPGMQNGKPVRVVYAIPINFTLSK